MDCEAKHQNCIIVFCWQLFKVQDSLLLSSTFCTAVLGNRKKTGRKTLHQHQQVTDYGKECGNCKFLLLKVTLLFHYSALPSWQGVGGT